MARILLAWELGGGIGHCVKLAPIAAALRQRGHDVHLAARDVRTTSSHCSHGVTRLLQAPYLRGHVPAPIRPTCTFAHVLHNAGFGDDGRLQALVHRWRDLIRSVQPALVLCEHAPTALLACRLEGVPRFVMGSGFSLPPDVAPLPDLRLPSVLEQSEMLQAEDCMVQRVNKLLAADGAAPMERLSQLYSDVSGRYLMALAELDHHPSRTGDVYRGAWSLAGGQRPTWPPGDGPRVFAYLKRAAPPWRVDQVVAALARAPVRALVYIAGTDERLRSLQTASLRIVDAPVDIQAAATGCDAAVLHGTAGTTMQLLLGGVPLALIPLYFEQAIMSQRVAQLGAGLVLPPRRAHGIAAVLVTLLESERFRDSAKGFAQQHAGYDARAQQDFIAAELDDAARALI